MNNLGFNWKCLTLTMFIVLAVPLSGTADNYFYSIEHNIDFSSADFSFKKINDYDFIYSDKHHYINTPGEPMLPITRVKIALPDGMKAENIRAVSIEIEDLTGEFNIFPAQAPLEIGIDPADVQFIEADKSIYNSSKPYPQKSIRLIRQSDLGGQSFAEIDICPFNYIPSSKNLRLITRLSFIIEGNEGYICGDYLPDQISDKHIEGYSKRLSGTILNKEEIELRPASGNLKRTSSLPSVTPFEHIIITTSFYEQLYEPLMIWRSRSGILDTVISTEYIYANYDGLSDKEKIREFVIDAHQNWGTMYFMLAGELHMIPFEYRNYDDDLIPSDAYYADYDDDWEYEVYVGRVSAEHQFEIERFINKLLKYEIDPPDFNFSTDVTLLGMDLTSASDAPYYTLTRGEYLMDSIDINYMPTTFSVNKVYDTHTGNHRDAFLAAINDGQNLINHNDHCNYTVMGCGDRNHGWYISSYDIPNLTNYHKCGSIVSIGCLANMMDNNDAISEHFVFGTDSTGSISFTGNTRSGWFYVGDPMGLSSDLNYHWWIGFLDQDITRLGELLAYCKSATSVETQHPYSDWTLNLLGDPATNIWTGFFYHINATHPVEVEALPGQFAVHVTSLGGQGSPNVLVCLWKGSEIYQRLYTDANGDVVFDINPTTNGTIYVTATRKNTLPYLGEAEVVGNVPPQCIVPDDTTIFQCEPTEINIPVGCYDPDGNLEYGPTLVRGEGQIIGSNWNFMPTVDDTIEVTIGCTDSLGFTCETTFFVTININDVPQLMVPNDTSIVETWPPSQLSFPLDIIDENTDSCFVSEGPGYIQNNEWVFTPSNDENSDIIIHVVDECGMTAENSFHLDYEVYQCGDADDNLTINILDITLLINYLYKQGVAPDPIGAGDANSDGTLNILDITFIIGYLYQSGPEPVCP